MPATRESDDVDDIVVGTYVYWLEQDDDIERNDLGEVTQWDEEKRNVQFPEGSWEIKATKLNVCDVQRKSFVHVVDDDFHFESIGEVKGLEDGKFEVEIEGEIKYFKPKYVIPCDFQPGMFCYWMKSDDDVPRDHLGYVHTGLTHKGKVEVEFPNGSWNFKPRDLVRAHVQPGSYVQWKKEDDDIPQGEVGKVIKAPNEEGKVKVAFAKGSCRFAPEDLFACEIQHGSLVTWEKHDEDIEKGEVGRVVGIKVDKGQLRVAFLKGTWKFKMSELSPCALQPGTFVRWKKSSEEVPEGDIGEVVRMHEKWNGMRVQFNRGAQTCRPRDLVKLPFQRGDRVHWSDEDEDIAKGDIGQVTSIKCKEDSGNRLYVHFPKGAWGFSPRSLVPLKLEDESINELKSTFKRFDKSGDGKLSPEELYAVLGKIGNGALSEEECNELFSALDKDGNGKLTTDEFVDYVFGAEASDSKKKLLKDGFSLGFEGFDPEGSDDEGPSNNSEAISEPGTYHVITSEEDVEGINGETTVSEAEWCSAMLAVGLCRAAALESYEACRRDVGASGDLSLAQLADELNGLGGVAGVQELRSAVGKVKHRKVPLLDLAVKASESDFEVELAKKTGLDGLLIHLLMQKKSLDEGPEELEQANLTAFETEVLKGLSDLPQALLEAQKHPATLSAVSSWQRAREACRRQVQAIIDECKSSGEKFVDKSWNPLEDENYVLYVDKEAPGFNCDIRRPKEWKRAKEVFEDADLVHGRADFNDIEQGHIGDCWLIGALGALVKSRKRFLRQSFVHYDVDVGVYGLMLYQESGFVFEIIDDVLGFDGKKPTYGRSKDREELWVPLIEKAFFKHHTCLEMCIAGRPWEAMYTFLGGVNGQYDVYGDTYRHPEKMFKIIEKALENGEVLATTYIRPMNMKEYWDLPKGKGGMNGGLIEKHCYGLLRAAEHGGKQLICTRNPWGKGEWLGPWSDKDEENWTESMKEALGFEKKDDGTFWMDVKDYVAFAENVVFIRSFGPTWQCAVARGHFGEGGATARVKKDYQACERSELSLRKGDIIELEKNKGSVGKKWCRGTLLREKKSGRFQHRYVDWQSKTVLKYKLSVQGLAEDSNVILALTVENAKMRREWMVKDDGSHWKNTLQPCGRMTWFDRDGKKDWKRLTERTVSDSLKVEKGPWTLYIHVLFGDGYRYNLLALAPHGTLHWEQEEISYEQFFEETS